MRMPISTTRFSAALVVAIAASAAVEVAPAKDVTSTVCGRDRCRTTAGDITELATLGGRVQAPTRGRFYTVTVAVKGGRAAGGWKVVYDAARQIVVAANASTRMFLGSSWVRLAPHLRPTYAAAVRGLTPMRAPPRYALR
jgi:hypothetical protein